MTRKHNVSLALGVVSVGILASLVILAVRAYQRSEEQSRQRWEQFHREGIENQREALRSGKSDFVHFNDTTHTDELLKLIENMPEVRRLGFELTDLSHEGLRKVAGFPNLRELTLYGGRPNANDAGLQHLRGHEQLETLKLINTDVTDRGLEVLETLPELRSLVLYRDQFREITLTTQCFSILRRLENLNQLNISGGWASAEAVQKLQAERPNCKISTDDRW